MENVEFENEFMQYAIEEAKKCKPEDSRYPKVGAVAEKDGRILGKAYRGEIAPGEHAEYTLLERKLKDISIAGCTIYTTLEPCTKRNPPKIPCVERLIERKVSRVVIGQLDPNPIITGRGQLALRMANVETSLFDPELMSIIEELNRDFTRYQKTNGLENLTREYENDQAHEIINWLQGNLQKITGSYIITNTKNENAKIAGQLYSRVNGEVISTCFFESPDYGHSDYANMISPATKFIRITCNDVCSDVVAKKVIDRLNSFECSASLVVVSSKINISKIGGIFCNLSDGSHLAFIAMNNRGGSNENQGIMLSGTIAREFFQYYKSFYL